MPPKNYSIRLKRVAPMKERFEAYFIKRRGCWLWSGNCDQDGYGRFFHDKKSDLAHRLSYRFYKGELDNKLTIDHLCRVRNCVNPRHLEQVKNIENVLRGFSPAAQNKRKTHCKRGHEYVPDSFYSYSSEPGKQRRHCKKCVAESSKHSNQKRREYFRWYYFNVKKNKSRELEDSND